jgi:hypothetical protein
MTTTTATRPTGGPIRRRLDARWRRRVDYPVLGQHYRTSAGIDLLRAMRMMIRFTGLLLVGFIAILICAFAGVSLPPNLHLLAVIPALAIMFASTPNMTSVLLWQVRPRWAQRWLDAGVQLTDLRLLSRSPLDPAQVNAYTTALGEAPELGVDVRLVWALHERGITPARLNAYVTAIGEPLLPSSTTLDQTIQHVWRPTTKATPDCTVLPTVEDILHIADHYTPDEWATLRAANPDTANLTLLRLALWMSTTRSTLDPRQFPDEATLPARPAATVAATLIAWTPHLPDTRFPDRHELCRETGPLPVSGRCQVCGTTDPNDHRTYIPHPADSSVLVQGSNTRRVRSSRTLREWAHACGSLAPHFLAGDFDYTTAANMCAQPVPPTVEMIATLAALRTDPL